MHNNNIKNFFVSALLIVLPISSSLCIDMYLPAYSSIARTFNVSEGAVNLSMSLYLFGLAIGQLIYGPLSDRFGRKIVLIIGLSFFAIASLLCMMSPTLHIFLAARLLQALGACSSIVLCRTIVTDSYHPEKRTAILALISATNIFSPALAPLLGGVIIHYANWRFIFFAITLFSLFMLIGILLLLKETLLVPDRAALHPSRLLFNLMRLLKNRLYMGYIFCLASLYATVFVWVTFSPSILIDHFHVKPDDFGLYFLLPSAGSTLGAIFTAKFSGYFSVQKLVRFGLFVILTASLLLNYIIFRHLVTSPFMIVFAIMMIFFGTGMTSPQLISIALSQFVDIGGFASGILGFVQTTSGSSMGAITSSFYNNSLYTLPILMLMAVGLAILFFLFATFHRKSTALVIIRKSRFSRFRWKKARKQEL